MLGNDVEVTSLLEKKKQTIILDTDYSVGCCPKYLLYPHNEPGLGTVKPCEEPGWGNQCPSVNHFPQHMCVVFIFDLAWLVGPPKWCVFTAIDSILSTHIYISR